MFCEEWALLFQDGSSIYQDLVATEVTSLDLSLFFRGSRNDMMNISGKWLFCKSFLSSGGRWI